MIVSEGGYPTRGDQEGATFIHKQRCTLRFNYFSVGPMSFAAPLAYFSPLAFSASVTALSSNSFASFTVNLTCFFAASVLMVFFSTHGRVAIASLTIAGHPAQVMPGTLYTT
jgi:hypothetical protein